MIVWTPKHPEATHLWQLMRKLEKEHQLPFVDYPSLYHWSLEQPSLFWQGICDFFNIQFNTPYQAVLSYTAHPHLPKMMNAHWFEGASFNFAEQLLKRDDHHPALIGLDEHHRRKVYSYHELRHEVAACAAGLQRLGVVAGDRVGAMMPNIPATIIAMLATVSLGAIWSSCSPDFGASAAFDRLGQINPKVLFICDGHFYQGKTHSGFAKIQEMNQLLPQLTAIVIYPFIEENFNLETIPKAILWADLLVLGATPHFKPHPFAHPLYILFSSGTTGKPKCIVHSAGGTLLQHLKELGLHTDLHSTDNLMFYTTCGWMMWNWMVSALALGVTLTLYDGAPTYPDTGRLFEIIEDEQVTVFGTSAKFISAVEKSGIVPRERYSLGHLKTILSTGSPLLPVNYDFVYQCIQPEVQLSSISGGTDIVSCFALGNPLLPIYRGELQCLGLGMAVQVFNEQGHPLQEAQGELVCTAPFPSMPLGFWNDEDKKKYHHAYFERFPGVWTHGDFAEMTAHQGLIIYGRSDAILNPGGIRIGTAEIYRQVEKIPEVLDSVVIGQDWEGDVRIVLFVKIRAGLILDEALKKSISQIIRQHASPHHVPQKILQVSDIPRTMSGKTVELAVREVVHHLPVQNRESLANPEVLKEYANREELR